MSAPTSAARSSRAYQSALLRARRLASYARIRPTCPSETAATNSRNPTRCVSCPEWPRSVSITRTRSGTHPRSRARWTRAYWFALALLVVVELARRGSPHVDHRAPAAMAWRDLLRTNQRDHERSPGRRAARCGGPPPGARRATRATPAGAAAADPGAVGGGTDWLPRAARPVGARAEGRAAPGPWVSLLAG